MGFGASGASVEKDKKRKKPNRKETSFPVDTHTIIL
jgi:hypothetical protein